MISRVRNSFMLMMVGSPQKDKELKLEEVEASLTLDGVGEGGVQGRGKWGGCTYYSTVKYTKSKWSLRNRAEVWGLVVE